jgi:TM2 domain-containing membrane protein YozV
MKYPSEKSYVVAVCLSAVFGFIGIQHFYLKRPIQGFIDVGLTIGWISCFVSGKVLLGVLLLIGDVAHSLVVTILLLTGSYRDGDGRYVCYPGQELN